MRYYVTRYQLSEEKSSSGVYIGNCGEIRNVAVLWCGTIKWARHILSKRLESSHVCSIIRVHTLIWNTRVFVCISEEWINYLNLHNMNSWQMMYPNLVAEWITFTKAEGKSLQNHEHQSTYNLNLLGFWWFLNYLNKVWLYYCHLLSFCFDSIQLSHWHQQMALNFESVVSD